jgi:hypothetical protein
LVVLHEASAHHILRREAFQLLIGDTAHQGGLAGTVATTETVSVALEETQVGVGQKKHTSVSKGEVGIDNLNLIRVLRDGLAELDLILCNVMGLNSSGNGLRVAIRKQTAEVWVNAVGDTVVHATVDILADHSGNEVLGQILQLGVTKATQTTVLLDLCIQHG